MRMIQKEIVLEAKSRGFHIITDELLSQIDISDFKVGMMNLFLKHTSASISINENFEREVRIDLENLFSEFCDDKPYYKHTLEGSDDMPAHAKSSLLGISLDIPITHGHLNLGTWQGIYLNEHRNFGGNRKIVVTIMGE